MPITRRTFVLRLCASTTALTAARPAVAKEPERLLETDRYARSLGYRHDTKNVDQEKFPRHNAGQYCADCDLFLGKPPEPWGPCSFFDDKLVPVKGWCRNFERRLSSGERKAKAAAK